jgi:N-acetylneuraminic acid mutarotase
MASSLNSCVMLDLTNQIAGWKSIAAMSTVRHFTSGVLLPDNNTFLVIGGTDGYGIFYSACEKLDIATNTWSSAGNLLGPRYSHCSVLFKNNVIVLGGSVNTCELYDPVLNTWSSFGPSFSTPRYHCSASVVLDTIYIAGGHNGVDLASVEVYNGTSWSSLSSSLAQTRYGCAAVILQKKLAVLGGYGGITTIEVFDTVMSTWNRTFPPMKISPSRSFLAAVSF